MMSNESSNQNRKATITRLTQETNIALSLNLDGSGNARIVTGVGFFDHMLDQICRHGLLDLEVTAEGDLHIDDHHTVEDIGIAFGQALQKAIGDKKGITRYGHAYVPLDEALSRVVIDFSGRAHLSFRASVPSQKVGEFDTELVQEFFQAVANHAQISLHIDNLAGQNSHHIIETIFKAFGRALRMAASADEGMINQIPSTKGKLVG